MTACFRLFRQMVEPLESQGHAIMDESGNGKDKRIVRVEPSAYRRFRLFDSWLAFRMFRNVLSVICVALLVKWLSILPWMTSSGQAEHVVIVVWDGNVDVVPTVLWILGLNPPQKLDDRILREALAPSMTPDRRPRKES